MKTKYLTSTLVILVIWYLGISFVDMELNPMVWNQESRIVFIILSIFTSIGYFILKELD